MAKNPRLPDLEKLKYLKFSSPAFSCLDIGANTGQFFLAMKSIFPDSNIISIEANPHCERRLKKHGINYKIIGLSDKPGELELVTTEQKPYSKGASFYPEVTLDSRTDILKIKVPTERLDNLYPSEIFELIKIDVQGAELDVINGGTDTISKCTYLLVEVALKEYNHGAPYALEVIKRLEELGFYIEDLVEEHSPGAFSQVQVDLLFTKRDKHNLENLKDFKEIIGL